MSFVIFSYLWLFSNTLGAQEAATGTESLSASRTFNLLDRLQWERSHPAISPKYFRGNFLIYDCEGMHFACVEEKNFLACKDKRENLIIQGEEKLPCAPFREYPTYGQCIKMQYELMHKGKPQAFCFKPSLN